MESVGLVELVVGTLRVATVLFSEVLLMQRISFERIETHQSSSSPTDAESYRYSAPGRELRAPVRLNQASHGDGSKVPCVPNWNGNGLSSCATESSTGPATGQEAPEAAVLKLS